MITGPTCQVYCDEPGYEAVVESHQILTQHGWLARPVPGWQFCTAPGAIEFFAFCPEHPQAQIPHPRVTPKLALVTH